MNKKTHLFICTNDNKSRACCENHGASKLRSSLKNWIKSENLSKDIQVTASKCLGHCSKGIVAVMYPHGKWMTNLTNQDEDMLKNILKDSLKK